jgi:AraC-like DNA-binding protein
MISTERLSRETHLLLNSCGIERIGAQKRAAVRPNGRVDYHILYIAQGTCHVKKQNEWQCADAGSLILFRPNESQEYYFEADSGAVSYYIHFTGRDCERILRQTGIYDVDLVAMGVSREFEEIFERMLAEYAAKRTAYEYVCAAFLLHLLTVIARRLERFGRNVSKKQEIRIEKALELLSASIQNPLSVEDVARECCMSVGRFSHAFKETVGMSPYAYLTLLRLEKAKELLRYTNDPISAVGEAIGYPDQNYFSRFFKKQVGVSPSEYRRTH